MLDTDVVYFPKSLRSQGAKDEVKGWGTPDVSQSIPIQQIMKTSNEQ